MTPESFEPRAFHFEIALLCIPRSAASSLDLHALSRYTKTSVHWSPDLSDTSLHRLPGDTVTDTDPVTFALEFVITMRKQKGLSHVPSLRTTLAIPRFLTARGMRTGSLSLRDYLDAAVLNTPYEDQKIAWEVGRDILFPKKEEKKTEAVPVTAGPTQTGKQGIQTASAAKSILDDLAAMDIDLDALDSLGDLDALLGQAEDAQVFSAFDLHERMLTSGDPVEQAVGNLVHRYGGGGELEARGIRTAEEAMALVRDLLRARVGNLDGEEIAEACSAGLGVMLRQEVRMPWELAGVLAGTRDFDGLKLHLDDTVVHGTAVEIGRTLRFLEPYAGVITATEMDAFRAVGRARARDLSEYAELLDGLRRWMPPDDALLQKSALENPARALSAGRWIDNMFGQNLQARVFDHWADAQWVKPELDTLLDLAVPTPRWEQLTEEVFQLWCFDLTDDQVQQGEALRIAHRLMRLETEFARKHAEETVTVAMEAVTERERFLATLDTFLDQGFFPSDPKRVVAAGVALGLLEEDVLERLGRPEDQLKAMIYGNMQDVERYRRLIDKLKNLPDELVRDLVARALGTDNLMGLATLLAVDLAGVAALLPVDVTTNALGYKGIGGGNNLLKQWFDHRGRVQDPLKSRIKEIARKALLDLAFNWIAKGSGTTEQGMVPQSRSRPFRGGDDLDQLDIETTLDAIISAGKPLDQVTEEDLWVPVTSKGRAAMGVLIDISGSMSGRELASCAIAVVMLLGRLAPEEVAIALFESDTHVVKTFDDARDLDDVADQLLDLAATGGTRVDRALEWMANQFSAVPEAEFRLMFLLSDFCFFESPAELNKRIRGLIEQDVRFMGAAHGHVDQKTAQLFRDAMPGEWVPLRDLDKVPALLQDAMTKIGNGW